MIEIKIPLLDPMTTYRDHLTPKIRLMKQIGPNGPAVQGGRPDMIEMIDAFWAEKQMEQTFVQLNPPPPTNISFPELSQT